MPWEIYIIRSQGRAEQNIRRSEVRIPVQVRIFLLRSDNLIYLYNPLGLLFSVLHVGSNLTKVPLNRKESFVKTLNAFKKGRHMVKETFRPHINNLWKWHRRSNRNFWLIMYHFIYVSTIFPETCLLLLGKIHPYFFIPISFTPLLWFSEIYHPHKQRINI